MKHAIFYFLITSVAAHPWVHTADSPNSIDYFPDPNQWEDSNALEEDTTLQSKAKAKPSLTPEWPFQNVKFDHPRQSPIDLVTNRAVLKVLPKLEIVEPDLKGHRAKFYNSGETVYVYMVEEQENRPYLIGGPLLDNKFIFEQMHFHWGNEDIWGSEHMIDGESFAVEIHMVHWNSKYATYENASKRDDGLAVLTVFAEGSEEENYLLTPLHELLSNISSAKSHVFMDTNDAMQWAVSGLKENDEYYSYPGSLTTEPYSENVVFILLPKPITLCKKQLHSFRTLHTEQNKCILDNKRQLQPLHNRPIVRSIVNLENTEEHSE